MKQTSDDISVVCFFFERKTMLNTKLLIRPSIIEDESVEGFIVRLSQLNGYEQIDSQYKFQHYYKSYLQEIKKLKNSFTNNYIYYDLAEQLTGQPITNGKNHNRKFLSQNELLLGHGSRWYDSITRFCPICLIESKYHRINWSIIPVIICEKHHCFLQYRCQKCYIEVNLKAMTTGKCSVCDNNITTQDVHQLDQGFLTKHSFLINNNYYTNERKIFHLNAQELFRLKKWLMYCIIDNVGSFKEQYNLDIGYSKNSNMVRITETNLDRVNEFVVFTDLLLSNWPMNLLDFLDIQKQKSNLGNFYDMFFKTTHNGKMRIFNFLNFLNFYK